jgi:2-dehydro-3-deoxy-D-arabinonate dehydratase
MRYYSTNPGDSDDKNPHLIAVDGDKAYDLTRAMTDLQRFTDLAQAASTAQADIDEIASRHCGAETELTRTATPGLGEFDTHEGTDRPLTPREVWAAGVTYEISEQAREDESTLPEMYQRVYEAERPEIFFKATPSRTVGPGEAIGVRGDSDWNVPEPELGIVLYREEVIGFTIGNDVSSRDIEGENPLYLPQAKVYDRCCALGPCVASAETVGDPHDLTLSMRIQRDGESLYDEETTTANLARSVDELVSYYTRHNTVPQVSVLLTGTSLVPDDEFTLEPGDLVAIDIENVGTLRNPVQEV